jgi:hypothetical protein
MLIEISCGEALDRLSILEIKLSEISDAEKRLNIQNEINSLSGIEEYKHKYKYYYDLLVFINKQLWDLNVHLIELIKKNDDTSVDTTGRHIFDVNMSRFRLKNIINKLCDSNLKEQKSYSENSILISLLESGTENLLDTLTDLSLRYDKVIIYCDDKMKQHIVSTIPEFNYVFLTESEMKRVSDLSPPLKT